MIRVVLLTLALLAPATAGATVLLPADFPAVVNGADLIVTGRIVDIRSQFTDARSIESYVTVAVDQTVKGPAMRTALFRVPNGTVGRYRRVTIGAPEFQEGDRVVLFLRARAGRVPTLFGLSQGVYRVAQAAEGQVVLPAPVMVRGVGAERVVRGDPARQPMRLDDFIRAVQTAMVSR